MGAKVWNNKYGTIVQKKGTQLHKMAGLCKTDGWMGHWEKYAQSANFRGVTWDLADMYSKHLPADQHTTSPETQVMEIVHLIRNILNSELWSQLCELWLFWYWWWWRYYVNWIKSANIWRLLHFEIVIVNKQYLRSFTPKKLVPSDQPDQSVWFPYRYPQTIVDSFTPKKSNIWSTCLINPGSIVKLPWFITQTVACQAFEFIKPYQSCSGRLLERIVMMMNASIGLVCELKL